MEQDDFRNIILSESRSSVRIQLRLNAMYSIDVETDHSSLTWHPCTILNISSGGVMLATAASLQKQRGEILSIRFNIGQEYILSTKVIWEQHFAHAHHYGLCWNAIPDSILEHLVWVLTRLAVRRRRMQKR